MREPTSATTSTPAGGGNLHPELIRLARSAYHTYLEDCDRLGQSAEPPIGVAVNRITHRAKVIPRRQPLLPQEYLVPLHLIDPKDFNQNRHPRPRSTRR